MQERQAFVGDAARRHVDIGIVFAGLPTPDEVHQFEGKVRARSPTLH